MSVVIVGNGPSILDEKKGNIIDSYDIVIRINDYVIEGYEEHTGKKTDIWAMDTKCFGWRFKFKERWQTVPEIWIVPAVTYFGSYESILQEAKKMHNNVHIATRGDAIKTRIKLRAFPSTGVSVIEFAFKKLSPPFSIVGFDACKTRNGKTDYWDEVAKPDTTHSHTQEALYIQGLAEIHMVKRL